MDVAIGVTIGGFLVQMITLILAIGHYSGKNEEITKQLQAQISQVAHDGRQTQEELRQYKDNHGELRTQVAVNDARLTESMTGMRKEMKELKDTMKEFTEEMRLWMRPKK